MDAVDNFLEVEHNLFSKFSYLPQKLGFSVVSKYGTQLINCGFGSSMFNIVCDIKLDQQSASAVIKNIIKDFNGRPFACWLGPSHTPKDIGTFLNAFGFVQETTEKAMICDLTQFKFDPMKTALVIKEAITPQEIFDFAEVLRPYDVEAPIFYQKVGALDDANNQPFRFFVGYLEGEPICTGSLFFTENLAGIFDLVTGEGYQGQGFGTAMMEFLMHYAQQKNFNYASLSASSDSGFRIYDRLGFKPLGNLECFEWPGSI